MGFLDRLRSLMGGGQTTAQPTKTTKTAATPAAPADAEATPAAESAAQAPKVLPQGSSPSAAHNGDAMMVAAVAMVGPDGSELAALVETLKAGGLQEHVDTWIGTGGNMPPSPKGLARALGADEISRVARSTGLSEDAVAAGLADALPLVVDKLTPEGMIPDADTMKRHYALQFKR